MADEVAETVYASEGADGAADSGATDSGEQGPQDNGAENNGEQGNTVLTGQDSNGEGGDANSEGAGSDDDGDAGKSEGKDDGAPESYADFTLPEGLKADAIALDKATPLFKELGLNQEQAQKLVDFEAERVQAMESAHRDAFAATTKEWAEAAQNDPDIGGEKFEQNIAVALKGLERFGSPELKQVLDTTGLGNHPAMIKLAFNVGKLLKEDDPGTTGNSPKPQQSMADRMYGD